jgi:hypothetical protein
MKPVGSSMVYLHGKRFVRLGGSFSFYFPVFDVSRPREALSTSGVEVMNPK